jgi:phosphoribosyl-ATP pyrophosphohydrolase
MNEFGYHTKEIKKGVLGEFSKIEEEFEELKDAYGQNDNIMVLCECSDLIGAIKHFIENKTKYSISLQDLIKFNEKTENAFKIGKR